MNMTESGEKEDRFLLEVMDMDKEETEEINASEKKYSDKNNKDKRNADKKARDNKAASGMKPPKEREKKNPLTTICLLQLLVMIISLGVALYSLQRQEESNRRIAELEEQLRQEMQAELELEERYRFSYTQDELDQRVTTAAEDAHEELLSRIRVEIESSGKGMSDIIRDLYPNYIVFSDSRYHFAAIDDTLERNAYTGDDFFVAENGEISYVGNDAVDGVKLIDVSKHNGKIDWEAVKAAGVENAYIRIGFRGYGSGAIVLDETFVDNMVSASENGINVGVYFYTQAITPEEAQEEVDFILENIEGYDVTLPIVLDVEDPEDSGARTNSLSAQNRTALVKIFCEAIKEAGYEPMIYGNTYSFFYMMNIGDLQDYPIWYAFYNTYPYYPYSNIRMWQYSAKGSISGISGYVDVNLMFVPKEL